MSLFKLFRIVVLLSILFAIVTGTWLTERRLASWQQPVWVTLYPIVDSESTGIMKFAKTLETEDFDAVNTFFRTELARYGVSMDAPIHFQLAAISSERPPEIPQRHNTIAIAWWSLRMRWWAWRREKPDGLVAPDIQMFLIYHESGENSEMQVSVGMRKGRYGLVKAYSGTDNSNYNNVVITHELLHVLGATDKYAFETGDPLYPEGYFEPNKQPLFPQTRAEIMAGVIPLSPSQYVLPGSLEQTRIGKKTAEEIGLFQRLIDR